jgi:hypothetical protein|tara:strand:+ start:1258 stop:1944 length:687 start_codon:yes stop_codon:yes gene_type:complete
MKIVISHGSGGIGSAETFARDFFESKGYEVHLIDYFTPHGIKNLWWSDGDKQDDHDITFSKMFDVEFPKGDIMHIGFSLGAFLGLIHHKRFIKNYLFYPGCIAITQSMLDVDYSTATVIVGTEDNGQNKYNIFKDMLKHPPSSHHYAPHAHHAFMLDEIDRTFKMVRYGNLGKVLSQQEFDELKPNHKYLSERYGHSSKETTLKSDNNYRLQYLTMIEKEISEYNTKV